MARKTNKTQHVMNLLSKSTEQDESLDDEKKEGSLHINSNEVSPIAKTVNDKLTELVFDEENGVTKEEVKAYEAPTVKEEEFTIPEDPVANIIAQAIKEEAKEILVEEKVEVIDNTPIVEEKVEVVDNIPIIEENQPVITPKSDEITNISEYKQEVFLDEEEEKLNKKPEEINHNTYVCINVAEEVVKEAAGEIMQKFNLCTCEICKNDVYAYALSSLPAKYVATHRGQLYAKLNSYSLQNSTDIITAITRACVRVKSNPHH